MAPPQTRQIVRVGGWLALAYVLAWLGWGVVYGTFDDGFALILFPLVVLWITGPGIAAAACVGASPTKAGAIAFLALELIAIGSVAWLFVEVSFIHPSSTAGLAFVVWPVVQWLGFALFFVLALAFGWRMRPDFLKD